MAYRSKVSASAKSYYSGMGYAVARRKKYIRFKNKKNKNSFLRGYRAGRRKTARNSRKYRKF